VICVLAIELYLGHRVRSLTLELEAAKTRTPPHWSRSAVGDPRTTPSFELPCGLRAIPSFAELMANNQHKVALLRQA
jgi:hypothetical protein